MPSDSRTTLLAGRLSALRLRLEAAALRVNRKATDVTLLAVSKKIPVSLMSEAIDAGQRLFGESYVQEAGQKIAHLRRHSAVLGDCCFHCIGPLQRNKAKRAVGLFDVIQTIDRFEVAQLVSTAAAAAGKAQRVLLQVNISGEATKSGIIPAEVRNVMESIICLPALAVQGLMCIGTFFPAEAPEAERRSEFIALRNIRDDLQASLGIALPELSMGMSDDFELAVEEGATIVRIGTALFGPRDG